MLWCRHLARQALCGLNHRRGRRISGIVFDDLFAVGAYRLGLGYRVEVLALVKLNVGHHEWLKPRAELRGGAANPFGYRTNLPVIPGQHGDYAVGLTQLVGAKNHCFVSIGRHLTILADHLAKSGQVPS